MPRKRKTQLGRPAGSNSEATMARILAAARTCFARTGFAATTNRDIAEEAGFTTATIYLYFESKTALYTATIRDAYAALVPQFRTAAGASSLRDGFRAVMAAAARVHEQDSSLATFFAALPVEMQRHAELARAINEEGREVVAIFYQLVETGVRQGEITAAAAPHVLSLFIACTMGFSLFAASIDGSQLGAILDTFSALIDGKLIRARPKRRRPKHA